MCAVTLLDRFGEKKLQFYPTHSIVSRCRVARKGRRCLTCYIISIFNSIYYRNTTSISTVLKFRSDKQYVPIVFHALIISLKLFEHKIVKYVRNSEMELLYSCIGDHFEFLAIV